MTLDKRHIGDQYLFNREYTRSTVSLSTFFYILTFQIIAFASGAVIYILFNLHNNFAGNVIISVILALVLDILFIRNIYLLIASIFKHFWARYNHYFISSSSIPNKTKSAEIVSKLIDEEPLTAKDIEEIKEIE